MTEWQKCYICIGTLETHECDNLEKDNIKTQNKCPQKITRFGLKTNDTQTRNLNGHN